MATKLSLKEIIEDNTTKWGRAFDYFIQVLIMISIITFSIETLPNNSDKLSASLNWIELFVVVIFSIEYILRLYVSDKPLRYATSFYGIIDILSIIPFYIGLGVDLRTLRVFRIFRVVRSLKVVRYNRALRRFALAIKIVKEEFLLFLMISGIVIYLSATGIYYFERVAQPEQFSSIFHSLWWAVVTLTTVGYGDIYPITVGGKIFTFVVLLVGIGIVTIPTGLVASALSQAREIEENENVKERIKR